MWQLSMVGSSKSTWAQSFATVETYLLGRSNHLIKIMNIITMTIMIRQEWRIEGDDYRCSQQGQPYTTTLKLTGLS